MIVRPYYLDILKTYRDVPLVKILAGIRRCGKSTILDMLKDDLLGSGIAADHVIHLRYTSEELDDGMTAKQMYRDIKEKMTDGATIFCWTRCRRWTAGKRLSTACWRIPIPTSM